MELLNLVIIFITGYLVLRKPQRESFAFRLLLLSIALMIFIFSLGTRTSLLPGLNY